MLEWRKPDVVRYNGHWLNEGGLRKQGCNKGRKHKHKTQTMKKLIQLLIVSSSLGFSSAFAGPTAEDKVKNNFSYNSPDDEVKFYVERNNGQITLQVIMPNIKGYDHVVFEKSSTQLDNYAEFKTVSCSDHIKYDGGAILQADKASKSDVYYRVKTVTSDGIARMYAPIQVPAPTK